jgi:hypothetical protein
MGPNPALHEPSPDALSGLSCGQCHTEQWEEYQTSGHGTAMERAGGMEAFVDEWKSSSCNYCHIAEGFLRRYDPASYPVSPTFANLEGNEISCGACHDSHLESSSIPSQLRVISADTLVYPANYIINDYGTGQLCGKCHKDRRDLTTQNNHINNGNAHFGPHDSPQLNLVEGVGTYIMDTTMTWIPTTPNPHAGLLQNMCVNCHVKAVPEGSGHYTATGHSFAPQTANCTCHAVDPDFDYNNSKDEVEVLMNALADSLVAHNPGLTLPLESGMVGDTTITTVNARKAAWAYFLVENDKSGGLHYPEYAKLILNNSITFYASVTAARNGKNYASTR